MQMNVVQKSSNAARNSVRCVPQNSSRSVDMCTHILHIHISYTTIVAISLVNYDHPRGVTMIERIGTRPPRRGVLAEKLSPVTRENLFFRRDKRDFRVEFHPLPSRSDATQLPHFPIRSGSFCALGKRSRASFTRLRYRGYVRKREEERRRER